MKDNRMKDSRMNDNRMQGSTSMQGNRAMRGNTAMQAGGMQMNSDRDVEVLNFALTLEYLESDFYNRVIAAHTARPYLIGRVPSVALILQRDENVHVVAVSDMIRKLGGTPIAKPEFQFPETAFRVNSAFLSLAADLEATGVMAYLGQGKRVKRDNVLRFAASIYGNEARHVGLVRYIWGPQFAPEPVEEPKTMKEIFTKISPFFVTTPNMSMMSS